MASCSICPVTTYCFDSWFDIPSFVLDCTDSKQKWKKIDIELPKQERRRRGGSRQRSSEVRDAPRGGRDRPATTRKYRPDQPEKTPVKDDVKVEATAAASSGSPTSQTSRRKEKGTSFEMFFFF